MQIKRVPIYKCVNWSIGIIFVFTHYLLPSINQVTANDKL